MKDPLNFFFVHPHRLAFGQRRCRRQALGLSDQTSLADKFVRAQECDNGLLSVLGDDGHFDFAFSNVKYRISILTLSKNDLLLGMPRDIAAGTHGG
jgi:hypothetical protein